MSSQALWHPRDMASLSARDISQKSPYRAVPLERRAVLQLATHTRGALRTAYGWLIVELLFVPEALRGKGVGAELMSLAESEAMSRGCHSAWLDTFEFQARGFYERMGYISFAQLSDEHPSLSRYFMKKALTV